MDDPGDSRGNGRGKQSASGGPYFDQPDESFGGFHETGYSRHEPEMGYGCQTIGPCNCPPVESGRWKFQNKSWRRLWRETLLSWRSLSREGQGTCQSLGIIQA